MANTKYKIRRGDNVRVISGGAKGQSGKVLQVNTDTDRVLVEGVNLVWKHKKPTAQNAQGSREQQEAPLHISNLMLVDAQGNTTRVGRREENGKLVRYSKKSGQTIPTPQV